MNNTKTDLASKAEKIGTLLLEADFFQQGSILILDQKYGAAGIITYLKILQRILAEGGWIRDLAIEVIIKQAEISPSESFCKELVELDLLYKNKHGFSSVKADQDLKKVFNKRESWRKNKAKYRKSLKGVLQDAERSDTRTIEHRTIEYRNKNIESRSGSSTDLDPVHAVKYGEFVFLKPADYDSLLAAHGEVFLKRCIEKLDNWIAQDPTPSKIQAGKNAINSFRKWVVDAISQESALKASGVSSSSLEISNKPLGRNRIIQERNILVVKNLIEKEKAKQNGN